MLQINDFWSDLSAKVLNFSGMTADMLATLLYAVVSIGTLHQGSNQFAASLHSQDKITNFSSFSRYLQRLDTTSRWARVALLICQHSNSDSVKASVMHPVKSSRITIAVSKGFPILQGLLKHSTQTSDWHRNQGGATVLHWQACSGLTMHSMHEPMQTLTRPKVSCIQGSVVGSCHLWGYV